MKIKILNLILLLSCSLLLSAQTNYQYFIHHLGWGQDVAISKNNTKFVVGNNSPATKEGYIYKWTGTGWTNLHGRYATRVAIDANDNPWIVNRYGRVYRYDNGSWIRITGQYAHDIAADDDGNIYIVERTARFGNNAVIYKYANGNWQNTGHMGVSVGIGKANNFWIIKANGLVYNNTTSRNILASSIDVFDDQPFIINAQHRPNATDGYIYKYNGREWRQFGGHGVEISVNPDGAPWIVNAGKGIYGYHEKPDNQVALSDFKHQTMTLGNAGYNSTVDLNVLLVRASYQDMGFSNGQTASFYENKYFNSYLHNIEDFLNENSPETQINVNHVKTISVTHNEDLDCAHRYDYCSNYFGGNGKNLDVSSNDRLWLTNGDNILYTRSATASSWTNLGRNARGVKASKIGNAVFYIGAAGTIQRFSWSGGDYNTNISTQEFAPVSYSKFYYATSTGALRRADIAYLGSYSYYTTSAMSVPAGYGYICQVATYGNDLVVLGSSSLANAQAGIGKLFKLNSSGGWTQMGNGQILSNVKDLILDNNSDPWIVENSTNIFKKFRNGRMQYWGGHGRDIAFTTQGVATFIDNGNWNGNGYVRRWTRTNGNGGHFPYAYTELMENISANDINFINSYDQNNDGVVTENELAIIFVNGLDGDGPTNYFGDLGGVVRSFPANPNLQGTNKTVGGRFVAVGDESNLITVIHEVLHLFGTHDCYPGNHKATCMAATVEANEFYCHLDPFHKMRTGFVDPEIIPITEWWRIKHVEYLNAASTDYYYNPIIFYDPNRSRNEYFMIEYRSQNYWSNDKDVAGTGIYVWRITEGANGSVSLGVINGGDYAYNGNQPWVASDGIIAPKWSDNTDSKLRIRLDPTGGSYTHAVTWWVDGSPYLRTSQEDTQVDVPVKNQPTFSLQDEGMNEDQITEDSSFDELDLSDTKQEEFSNHEVAASLYPNPVQDVLFVKTEDEVTELQVFSVNGEWHRNLEIDLQAKSVNVASLPAGSYVIRMMTTRGSKTLKFVKL